MTTFVEKGIKLADAYRRHGIKVTLIFYLCPIKICDILRFVIAVLQIWIRIQIRIHRIHMFLGLPDPDPLVRGMDPDPALDPDPSIIKQIW